MDKSNPRGDVSVVERQDWLDRVLSLPDELLCNVLGLYRCAFYPLCSWVCPIDEPDSSEDEVVTLLEQEGAQARFSHYMDAHAEVRTCLLNCTVCVRVCIDNSLTALTLVDCPPA